MEQRAEDFVQVLETLDQPLYTKSSSCSKPTQLEALWTQWCCSHLISAPTNIYKSQDETRQHRSERAVNKTHKGAALCVNLHI